MEFNDIILVLSAAKCEFCLVVSSYCFQQITPFCNGDKFSSVVFFVPGVSINLTSGELAAMICLDGKGKTRAFREAAPICPIGAQEGVPLCHLQTSKLPFLILRHAVIQRLSPFHARSI